MVNFDDVTKENINEDNPNWSQISNHPYRILIIGGSGSRKQTNCLIWSSNKMMIIILLIVLYVKDPNEEKYQQTWNVKKWSLTSEKSKDSFWIFK